MKTSQLLQQSSVLFIALLIAVGCAKGGGGFGTNDDGNASSGGGGAIIIDPVVTPTPTPGTDTTDYWASEAGGSAIFSPASIAVMTTYVGTHPLNAPTNFRVLVDLQDIGGGAMSGTVKIGYIDNGQLYTGVFSSENPNGQATNVISYKNAYKGLPNSYFNRWVNLNGQKFRGFFQDGYGSIVVVVDGGLDLGDGGGLTNLSGRIYFKNFRQTPAPQFQGGQGEQCWFLFSPSPWECGTYRVNGVVSNSSTEVYPSSADGYTFLGTFTALDRAKAFK